MHYLSHSIYKHRKKVVYLNKQKCELPTFNLNTFKLKNNTLGLFPTKDILHFPCAGWETRYHLSHICRRKTPMCDNQETISDIPLKLVLDVFWCWWCSNSTSCVDYEGVWTLLRAVVAVGVRGSTSSVFLSRQQHADCKVILPYSLHQTLHRAQEKILKSKSCMQLYQVIALTIDTRITYF